MKKAVVIKKISNFFYCYSDGIVYESKSRGNLNKGNHSIIVGDRVSITPDEKNCAAIIEKIYDRKNMLKRPQIANIDQAIAVFSVKEPQLNTFVIDSFISTIEKEGIDIVICFSKIDLDKDKAYRKISKIYSDIGYDIIEFSDREYENIDAIKKVLSGKTTVFAGPSGVGKSSLINCISEDFNLKTGQISTKLQKGKNTTTYVQLLKVDENSYVADTPGFTSIRLDDIPKTHLKEYFVEFATYCSDCKFTNSCLHWKEPDCGVKSKVGEYIHNSRYENYIKILEKLDNKY